MKTSQSHTSNVTSYPLLITLAVLSIIGGLLVSNKNSTTKLTSLNPQLTTSKAGFNDIVIQARGTNNKEKIALFINNAPVQFWNLSNNFKDYTYTPNGEITIQELSIHFLNDTWEPENNINYDVQIPYITVNGTTYNSEHSSTVSTGSWDQDNWCAPGNKQTQWLNCNGSFTYNIPVGTVVGVPTNTPNNGVCGSANQTSTDTAPTENLCAQGSPTTPTNDATNNAWRWTCEGTSGGSTTACSVQKESEPTGPETTATLTQDPELLETNDTSVRIRFRFSEGAPARIEYGETLSYGSSTNGDATSTYATHVQSIEGLKPGTLYHYRVVTKDDQGNDLFTRDYTFTTTGTPLPTASICGNGQTEGTEQCDDGNTDSGDGCSAACEIEQTQGTLTLDSHEATTITENSAKIRIVFNENAQATTEYGTTTSYGQTKSESSFTYATHVQTLSGLTPNTKYYYRITGTNQAGHTARVTGSFTTESTGGTTPPPQGAGEGMTFSEIKANKPSFANLSNANEYTAEYLRQNPEVCFWKTSSNSVVPLSDPEPGNSTVVTLSRSNGSNDTAMIQDAINRANGGTVKGSGDVYHIKDLKISRSVTIRNMPMRPVKGTSTMVSVSAPNVRIFDSLMDIKNTNGVNGGYQLNEGSHGFVLVRSGVINLYDTTKINKYGILLGESNDAHISCNQFKNLVGKVGGTSAGATRAIWINPGESGSLVIKGGTIANNTFENIHADNNYKDAEAITLQGFAGNEVQDRPLLIMANRSLDMGKRFVKLQDGNARVLSNIAHWDTDTGPLGSRTNHAMVDVHYSSDVDVKNNHLIYSSNRTPQSMFAMIQSPGAVPRNNHFDYNRLEYRNNPPYTYASSLMYIWVVGKQVGAHEQTTSSFENNVIDGPGKPKYFYSMPEYANPTRFPVGSNTFNTTWNDREYR